MGEGFVHAAHAIEQEQVVAGWAALTAASDRCVYGGVAEVSVYVGQNFRGQGIGQALLQQLVAESEANGFWTLQAGTFPENIGRIHIHEKCGFRVLGRRERIGQMGGARYCWNGGVEWLECEWAVFLALFLHLHLISMF